MRESDRAHPDVARFDCGPESYARPIAEALASGMAWEAQQSGEGQTWLMEVNDRVAGFVNTRKKLLSYPKWNGKRRIRVLEVAWLGVAREFQRRGLGKYMLMTVIAEANNDLSVDKVYLLVHESNPAVRLYQDVGFVPHPTAPPYIEDGARHWRMILDLVR